MTLNRYRISNQTPRGSLRRMGLGLAFIGLAFLLGYSKLRDTLPDKIRAEIETRLNNELNQFGLTAELRQAEFFHGKGIRLTDLRIRDQDSQGRDPVIEIHESFIHIPTSLTELALGNSQVHSIDFRGGKIALARDVNGAWRIEALLRHLHAKCTAAPSDMTVRLVDFSLRIDDESASANRIRTIRDINLVIGPVIHNDRKLVQITGDCSGLAVSHVQFETFLDPEHQSWFANIHANNAQLTTEFLTLLPASTAAMFKDVQVLGGQLDLHGTANGNFDDTSAPHFNITGQLRNFSLSDRRLPLSLKSCHIDFHVAPSGFEIIRAVGVAGKGTFDISYQQQGLLTRNSWSAAGQLVEFNLTGEIHPWLPDGCTQFCKDFSPQGISNIDFQIAFDGRQYSRNILAEITNMEFNFHKFPYPFQQCRGNVSWIDDDCRFDVRSHIGRQPVRVSGNVRGRGSLATYEVEVNANGKFAIDEKLLAALDPYPEIKKQVLAFRTTGFVSCTGSIVKSRPDEAVPAQSFDVQLHNCNVNHDAFRYPIGNVNGLIRIRNHDCSFENVTGANGNAQIRCDGSWGKRLGLQLRFLCRQVPFDETLRNALRSNIQEIWNGIRPSGNIGFLNVMMLLPPGADEVDIVVSANLSGEQTTELNPQNGPVKSTVSISPTWFPYKINELTGKVKIGRGRIELTEMHGKHRRTWIECQGNGTYSEQAWAVSLKNILVGALQVEDDLLHALPPSLSVPLTSLEFEGILHMQGEISMGSSQASPTNVPTPSTNIAQVSFQAPPVQNSTRLFWDLRLDMDQASMLLGLPVENVFGMIRLAGEYDGLTASCAGELAIDSLMLMGAQITNIHGPIWIDEHGVSAGTLAHQCQSDEPRQIIGKICNGQIRFDARKQVDEDGTFFVQASLTDGCLKDLVDDFAPYAQNISGRFYGALRFVGNDTGAHSYHGEGTMQLRDAQIYELPLVLSLLKILRIKEVNRTAFDSSNIDFTINGSDVELNRIELIGDAISLIGNGQINFNRQLDLNFYSVVGRNRFYIPLLSELYRAGSQSILWINIDGTLDQPITHRNILPQLNDAIRVLLQAPEGGLQLDSQFFPGQGLVPFDSPLGKTTPNPSRAPVSTPTIGE